LPRLIESHFKTQFQFHTMKLHRQPPGTPLCRKTEDFLPLVMDLVELLRRPSTSDLVRISMLDFSKSFSLQSPSTCLLCPRFLHLRGHVSTNWHPSFLHLTGHVPTTWLGPMKEHGVRCSYRSSKVHRIPRDFSLFNRSIRDCKRRTKRTRTKRLKSTSFTPRERSEVWGNF